LAETEGRGTSRNLHEYRHFKTFRLTQQTGVRPGGEVLRIVQDRDIVLAKSLVCVTQEQDLWNQEWLAYAENISEEQLGKKQDRGRPFDFQTQSALHRSAISCTFKLFGVVLFPFWDKLLCQKNHHLGNKFGIWHVMCSGLSHKL
jgi:hypothetical protein